MVVREPMTVISWYLTSATGHLPGSLCIWGPAEPLPPVSPPLAQSFPLQDGLKISLRIAPVWSPGALSKGQSNKVLLSLRSNASDVLEQSLSLELLPPGLCHLLLLWSNHELMISCLKWLFQCPSCPLFLTLAWSMSMSSITLCLQMTLTRVSQPSRAPASRPLPADAPRASPPPRIHAVTFSTPAPNRLFYQWLPDGPITFPGWRYEGQEKPSLEGDLP